MLIPLDEGISLRQIFAFLGFTQKTLFFFLLAYFGWSMMMYVNQSVMYFRFIFFFPVSKMLQHFFSLILFFDGIRV